jgi:hypothetical protein
MNEFRKPINSENIHLSGTRTRDIPACSIVPHLSMKEDHMSEQGCSSEDSGFVTAEVLGNTGLYARHYSFSLTGWMAFFTESQSWISNTTFFLFENADISTYGRGQAVKARQPIRELFPHPPTVILTSRRVIQFRDKIVKSLQKRSLRQNAYTELLCTAVSRNYFTFLNTLNGT